jgi:rhamnose utilization protein RhaD (predicted bifunctional aldolase and dehydrogenase)/NAD(P)-dependent dehydrogenase (short-subunit alcohol dehydrogenase family)
MKNRFDATEAQGFVKKHPSLSEDLALRLYTSRLIGGDPGLVLHGGGNTSVKLKSRNILGEERDLLYVKGSGADLASLGPKGLVGLELQELQKLKSLADLSDEEMENQLKIHKIHFRSPDPSVEALLHAFLPQRYVDHTHAQSILILTHQKHGEERIAEALGPGVGILPYLRSGFPLAKAAIALYENNPHLEAIVLMNHGIFTFADEAKASYENMIRFVRNAESYIEKRLQGRPLYHPRTASSPLPSPDIARSTARVCSVIRGACAHPDPGGNLRRFYTDVRSTPAMVEASCSEEATDLCECGALTPDHLIWTKNRAVYIESVPEGDESLISIVKQEVESYVRDYDRYFERYSALRGMKPEKLDPYPRIFLVSGIGLVALGLTRQMARIAADIAERSFQAKPFAMAMDGYLPLEESHAFDMEYWGLQQKKLVKAAPPLQGQVAVVTGGGGAIGLGIADRLLAAGALVVLCDIEKTRVEKVRSILLRKYDESLVEHLVFDVTDYPSVEKAFDEISGRAGGIDILVPNAGIAHVAKIEDLDPGKFRQVIDVNLMGTFHMLKASVPIFKRQQTGGNIVVISSKNVFDPGAAFGAYSASKAGAHQIGKIAALELAEIGVRVNMVNPDAVFGDEEISSGLWDLVGPDRMKARGLDAAGLKEYYRQRNLLKTRVLAEHVGNAVVFFASNQTPTTGATLPVDGGIPAAFPR